MNEKQKNYTCKEQTGNRLEFAVTVILAELEWKEWKCLILRDGCYNALFFVTMDKKS